MIGCLPIMLYPLKATNIILLIAIIITEVFVFKHINMKSMYIIMKRKMLVIVAMIAMIFSLSVVSAKEVEVNDAATLLAAFKNAESGDVVKLPS